MAQIGLNKGRLIGPGCGRCTATGRGGLDGIDYRAGLCPGVQPNFQAFADESPYARLAALGGLGLIYALEILGLKGSLRPNDVCCLVPRWVVCWLDRAG